MDKRLLVDTDKLHEMKIKYYGLVTMLDKGIGDILDTLKQSGKLDNTIIDFTADHGEFLGDHYMRNKLLFYEPSSAIPCTSRWRDGGRGRQSNKPVKIERCFRIARTTGENHLKILNSQDVAFWAGLVCHNCIVDLATHTNGKIESIPGRR